MAQEDMDMMTVPESLRYHASLDGQCLDRICLNGCVPTLQTSGALVYVLERRQGALVASPTLLGKISRRFNADVKACAE